MYQTTNKSQYIGSAALLTTGFPYLFVVFLNLRMQLSSKQLFSSNPIFCADKQKHADVIDDTKKIF